MIHLLESVTVYTRLCIGRGRDKELKKQHKQLTHQSMPKHMPPCHDDENRMVIPWFSVRFSPDPSFDAISHRLGHFSRRPLAMGCILRVGDLLQRDQAEDWDSPRVRAVCHAASLAERSALFRATNGQSPRWGIPLRVAQQTS